MPQRSPLARSLSLVLLACLGSAAAARPGQVLGVQERGALAAPAVAPAVAPLYAKSGMPQPRYGVTRYRLQVRSTDERGRPIRVNALLYVPVMPQGTRVPLYVMGPGTTGLASACAPTGERVEQDNWGNYEAHMLSYAAQGYVGILPDWANFSDPDGVQPYFIAHSEGRVMLDAARAARRYVRSRDSGVKLTKQTFLAGFSQGGHAAFAAADLARSYAPELSITGVIGYAPAMDVQTLMRERPALGPYLARSYAAYYGIDPGRILQPRWLEKLEQQAGRWCVSEAYRQYPHELHSIYRPEFLAALKAGTLQQYDLRLAKLLRRNAPGFHPSGREIPALVLTGLTDPIVTADAQLTFMRKSCAFGRNIVQYGYEHANHFQARQFGFRDTLAWMSDLASGERPAPSSCGLAKYHMPGQPPKGAPVFAGEQR